MGNLRQSLATISGARILDPEVVSVVSADLVVAVLDMGSPDLQLALNIRRSLKKPLLSFYPRSYAGIIPGDEIRLYSSDEDITDCVDSFVQRRDPSRETLRVVC
jgi:hypothetical protein